MTCAPNRATWARTSSANSAGLSPSSFRAIARTRLHDRRLRLAGKDKPITGQLLEQFLDVSADRVGIHIRVGLRERGTQIIERPMHTQKLPDPRTDGVQAEVHLVRCREQHRALGERTVDNRWVRNR